jgi:hypothetical protein
MKIKGNLLIILTVFFAGIIVGRLIHTSLNTLKYELVDLGPAPQSGAWGQNDTLVTSKPFEEEKWISKGAIEVSPSRDLVVPMEDTATKTVYITKTGSKYHCAGCSYLSKSCIPINLASAIKRGYTPCSKCNPQTSSLSTPSYTAPRTEVAPPAKPIQPTAMPLPTKEDKFANKMEEIRRKYTVTPMDSPYEAAYKELGLRKTTMEMAIKAEYIKDKTDAGDDEYLQNLASAKHTLLQQKIHRWNEEIEIAIKTIKDDNRFSDEEKEGAIRLYLARTEDPISVLPNGILSD